MGGITGSFSVTVGAGLSGNGTPASPLSNTGVLSFNSRAGAVATQGELVAWGNFYGRGGVSIRGSANIGSITRNSAGNYRVNFSTALVDANYSVTAGGAFSATAVLTGSDLITTSNYSTTGFDMVTHISGSGAQEDLDLITFMVAR